MDRSAAQAELTPSQLIDNRIAELTDWRGETFARLRKLLNEAAPELTEDWKWSTGVWTCKGNVVSIGAMKDHIKLNFFKGASLNDPHGLFNAGMEAKATRAIDLFEGDSIDETALAELVRTAVALNVTGEKKK